VIYNKKDKLNNKIFQKCFKNTHSYSILKQVQKLHKELNKLFIKLLECLYNNRKKRTFTSREARKKEVNKDKLPRVKYQLVIQQSFKANNTKENKVIINNTVATQVEHI
jgi:hypothetical protein